MDWDSVGAIGEIIGAVAVVVSLFYVGSQVKQNATSVRGQTHESITRTMVDVNLLLASDPDLSVAISRANAGNELSNEQYQRTLNVLGALVRIAAAAHHQHSLGLLDDEELDIYTKGTSWMLSSPTGQAVWDVVRDSHTLAFRHHVEDQLKQNENSALNNKAQKVLNRE